MLGILDIAECRLIELMIESEFRSMPAGLNMDGEIYEVIACECNEWSRLEVGKLRTYITGMFGYNFDVCDIC